MSQGSNQRGGAASDRPVRPAPVRPTAADPIDLGEALARLEARWGSAAIRLGGGGAVASGSSAGAAGEASGSSGSAPRAARPLTEGALAPVIEEQRDPDHEPAPLHPLAPLPLDVVSTGFSLLDAVIGTGGLPREAQATFRGGPSSGKTTLALRCIAEAQSRGSICAWLDLAGALDPFEAVCRGVDLEWLVVLRPADPGEGLDLAGSLLAGRAIDLLVVDLPARLRASGRARAEERLRRLAARARGSLARLIVLEPRGLPERLQEALGGSVGLRLELERRAWIRDGRDVVGQRVEVTVAKNRFGPPGRRAELEIRYADA